MTAMTTRRVVVPLAVVAALVAVAAATRTWASGAVDDAVLGASTVTATGSQLAAGYVGAVLVAAAGILAAAVTGVRIRLAAALAAIVGAGGAVLQVVLVVADPGGRLGPVAAAAVGRSGPLPVAGSASVGAYAALAAAIVLTLAGLLALAGARSWPAPSSRYDAPGEGGDPLATGARGERIGSDWERLTAGEDPTDVPPPPST